MNINYVYVFAATMIVYLAVVAYFNFWMGFVPFVIGRLAYHRLERSNNIAQYTNNQPYANGELK